MQAAPWKRKPTHSLHTDGSFRSGEPEGCLKAPSPGADILCAATRPYHSPGAPRQPWGETRRRPARSLRRSPAHSTGSPLPRARSSSRLPAISAGRAGGSGHRLSLPSAGRLARQMAAGAALPPRPSHLTLRRRKGLEMAAPGTK